MKGDDCLPTAIVKFLGCQFIFLYETASFLEGA